MDKLLLYFCVFAASLIVSLCLTRFAIVAARKLDFMDIPLGEQHKGHKKATPLLGGAAMFLSVFSVLGAGGAFLLRSGLFPEITGGTGIVFRESAALFLCAAATVILGTRDDKRAMKAGPKFAGQLVISSAAILSGCASITLFIPNPVFSFAVTLFWFLLIYNAINFFDNMDGLAAGTAFLAFAFFTIAAAVNQQYLVAILGAACAGGAGGFWWWNRAPARIFMGDGGSLFLGFMLSVISARVTYYVPGVSTTKLTLLIPLFILAMPLLDTLTVVLIRLKNHKPVYVGDHNHISHRFWHMGLTRPQAVGLVHLLVLISGLGALPLLWGDEKTCILLILQGILIYLLILFLQITLKGGPEK